MNNDLFSLKNRTALVTGSSRGIGFSIARSLGTAGAKLILNGRDEARLEKAVSELNKEGFDVSGVSFDVTDIPGIQKSIDRIESSIQIDILVNNAGIQIRGALEDFGLEDWQKILDVNLTGVFLVSKIAARNMISRNKGKIINISSLQSELARPTIAPYAASKGGLKMLTRSMAAEWAKYNIQINAIAPGYFLTDMTRALSEDPQFDKWIKSRTPACRWGDPEELGGAAIMLASDASSFINGQTIIIDGGLSSVI